MPDRTIEILLVEDNPGDVRLTLAGLRRAKILNRVHVAEDGVEALAFLRREGPHRAAPRPDLVLLDLGLPRLDGHEVLAEIRRDAALRDLAVIVVTGSGDEEDRARAGVLEANGYVTKPVDFDAFIEIVRRLDGFWLSVSRVPRVIA